MKLALDWRAYDAYGEGDAYAAVPKSGDGFGKAAALCIGSRQCQKARGEPGDKGVMCPSFRIRHDELHSTRGRAAALRQALDGELGAQAFAGPELAAAMDLCVACKGCKRECPNGVDMAALRAETLAQRWQTQAPSRRTRLFATLPQWLPRVAAVPGLRALIALRNRMPLLARLGERLTGIAAQRSLPVPAAQPFDQRAARASAPAVPASPAAGAAPAPAAPAPREVALLVDCFANHLDPAVAEAAVDVLRAAGLVVHPVVAAPAKDGKDALCCGRAAWSAGFVDRAREQARTLLAALAPHLAAGRPVIGLEPSCLSMLRDEVHLMGLDPDAVQALGRQALMLEEYLARELDAKRLSLPLQALPATALVHGHCHQKAFGTLKSLRKLLAQVPQLQVQWIESSCCGMAGSFGYEAEHHADSLAMAELSLLPAVRAAAPEALLVASGTSCRHQIRDGAQRESLHLAQLLQAALPVARSAR
ncbi:4Fe-4S dicluster domain-containing protein [Ideonella sp. DXS22W]|uniref:4Fe-4S dicluster domain-containing protein n=1 Tax=Pseudaquabacterium inlustre TaxID=2984192 RepID=A0ABU9CLC9_9BURK